MALANILAGLTIAQIAQRSLKALLPELFLLKAFVTDFSDEIDKKGGSVTTRYPVRVTATDVSGGYTAALANSQSVPVTIPLNVNDGYAYGFKDSELSTIGLDTLDRLFTEPARNAINTAVIGALLALITPGNFPNASVIASPTANAMAVLAGICNTTYMAKGGRYAMLGTAFNTALTQDPAIQALYASGSGLALREHQAGRLSTFDTYEYTEIPTANNLVAFAGAPEALCVAARQVEVPFAPQLQVENVIDPDTGLPLQYRMWYNPDLKQLNLAVEILFGVAVGNPGQLRRIVSA